MGAANSQPGATEAEIETRRARERQKWIGAALLVGVAAYVWSRRSEADNEEEEEEEDENADRRRRRRRRRHRCQRDNAPRSLRNVRGGSAPARRAQGARTKTGTQSRPRVAPLRAQGGSGSSRDAAFRTGAASVGSEALGRVLAVSTSLRAQSSDLRLTQPMLTGPDYALVSPNKEVALVTVDGHLVLLRGHYADGATSAWPLGFDNVAVVVAGATDDRPGGQAPLDYRLALVYDDASRSATIRLQSTHAGRNEWEQREEQARFFPTIDMVDLAQASSIKLGWSVSDAGVAWYTLSAHTEQITLKISSRFTGDPTASAQDRKDNATTNNVAPVPLMLSNSEGASARLALKGSRKVERRGGASPYRVLVATAPLRGQTSGEQLRYPSALISPDGAAEFIALVAIDGELRLLRRPEDTQSSSIAEYETISVVVPKRPEDKGLLDFRLALVHDVDQGGAELQLQSSPTGRNNWTRRVEGRSAFPYLNVNLSDAQMLDLKWYVSDTGEAEFIFETVFGDNSIWIHNRFA